MNNKLLIALPITTLLLCSMNGSNAFNEDKAHPLVARPAYNNYFDYIIVGAALFGYQTNIYYEASFKTASAINKVEILKYKPLTKDFISIHTYTSSSSRAFKNSVLADEIYTQKEYEDVGMIGPAFLFKVTSSEGTRSHVVYSYCRDYNNPITYSPNKNEQSVRGDNIIYYYNGQTDEINTTYEFAKFTDYAKDATYEFDSQNFIYETEPLFYAAVSNDYNFIPEFIYSPAYLKMVDTNNYFPYLHQSNSDPTILIRGEFFKTDTYSNNLSFRLNDSLYIDPSTRLTFKSKKTGLVKTKKLFFPLGSKLIGNPEDEANRFYVVAERGGASKSIFSIPIKISSFSTSLIGDCPTSEYCIQMEESVPDFSLLEEE